MDGREARIPGDDEHRALTPFEYAEQVRLDEQRRAIGDGGETSAPPTRGQILAWLGHHTSTLRRIAAQQGADDVDAVVKHYIDLLSSVDTPNPFDEPGTRAILAQLMGWCHDALVHAQIELPTPSFGVLFTPDVNAQGSLTVGGVPLVLVNQPLFAFCNAISKLFLTTALFRSSGRPHEAQLDTARVASAIESHPELLFELTMTIGMYAAIGQYQHSFSFGTDNHVLVRLRYDLLVAMEMFVVGHEIGHTLAQESRARAAAGEASSEGITDAHRKEFQADLVAATIAAVHGRNNDIVFMRTGVGGSLALAWLDIVARARAVIATGDVKEYLSATHPSLEDRLERFGVTIDEALSEEKREGARLLRVECLKVTELMWAQMLPYFEALHREGVRPIPGLSVPLH